MSQNNTTRITAKAMLFREAEKAFDQQETRLPDLNKGEVLVEISYTTICTSDLHTFYGRRHGPVPTILGHEITGIVAAQGGNTYDFKGELLQAGDKITWSVYAHDPGSEMARRGFPQKSPGLFKYGHQQVNAEHPLSGGFATHCLLRKGTSIFKLPPHIPLKTAAPLNCTHATIAGALRLAGDLRNKNVLVSGVGMLGLSACAMSKEAGARSVIATDPDEQRLRRAASFGADHGVKANDPALQTHIMEWGGIDVLIETSGIPTAMETAMDLMNIGGVTVWVGAVFSQRNLQINAERIVRNLLTIKGLHNYIPEDLQTAIEFISSHGKNYPFDELVSREFPLEQLTEAFTEANDKRNYRVGICF